MEQIKLEVARQLKTYEPTLANGIISPDVYKRNDGLYYELIWKRPEACAKPCATRQMLGRDWYKLLGYAFDCACAWDALEVSLTNKLIKEYYCNTCCKK